MRWSELECQLWGGMLDVELVDPAQVRGTTEVTAPVVVEQEEAATLESYAMRPLLPRVERALLPRLRAHLQGRLPEYMLPAGWVLLWRPSAHGQRQGGSQGAASPRGSPGCR